MVLYKLNDQTISLQLPDATKKELDFTGTSFFTSPDRHLPTPAEVRALSKDIGLTPQPKPIQFESLNLIVKFGPSVTTVEAQNLWMIKKVFKNKIPVPELFGWRVDHKGHVFIYMELIKGPTLEECWQTLSSVEKGAISDQLSAIMKTLRQLEQHPSDQFIGSINHRHLLDYVFTVQPRTGPFSNIKEFNDWFALLHQLPFPHRYDDPNRCFLPDDGKITFSHADLNRRNMIVSSNPTRVVLIDWEQSGWYPDYWEYCKALYTCLYEDLWRTDYIDHFLQPRDDIYLVFAEYIMAMGAFRFDALRVLRLWCCRIVTYYDVVWIGTYVTVGGITS
ncbi:phosphotransferase enzyme family protein [Aspergillus coremiiformis]|uniref:Phosphotransferase enzyme family protein n=1 Tax=Aspergillus coremiiformis TaxID=138285 RepID=A0A5N6ZCJ3_9EURO|nr:phosphotransferase enzyme family protein [Aspergillus coremiiformis]